MLSSLMVLNRVLFALCLRGRQALSRVGHDAISDNRTACSPVLGGRNSMILKHVQTLFLARLQGLLRTVSVMWIQWRS